MDASRHVNEGKRLNQALNGELDKISGSIKEVLIQNNLHSMPGIAFDTIYFRPCKRFGNKLETK